MRQMIEEIVEVFKDTYNYWAPYRRIAWNALNAKEM